MHQPRFAIAARRALTATAGAALIALAATATAPAASIVYLDQTYNVRITSPDGAHQKAVTTDGTPDKRYTAPTADDGGAILSYGHPDRFAGRIMSQDGQDVRGPWLLPAPTCSLGPLFTDIARDGKLIAASWIDAGTGPTSCISVGQLTTSILFGDAPTLNAHNGSAALPSFDNASSPRWVYRPSQRLAAIDNGIIVVQDLEAQPQTGQLAPWLTIPSAAADLDSFDVSRAADRLLVETSPVGAPDAGERRDLELLTFTGAPPNAATTHVCFVDGLVAASTRPAHPRWSPDGTMISWSGPEGVFVSSAPVPGAGDQCALQPKLVAAGGFYAAWTAADVAVPAGPPAGTPGGTNTSGTTTPATSQSLSKPKLRRATAAGGIVLAVTLRSAAVIRVKVERLPATRKGRARLLGTLRFAGKAGANALRLRKVARRALRKGRYRLTITVPGAAARTIVVRIAR